MGRLEKLLDKYFVLTLVLAVVLSSWALFVPGFFGASDEVHIAWLHQMDASLRSGQIPPRFVPDLSFKFGYPLFNFVFPFPYYIGEVFHLVGFGFVDSVKITFFVATMVGALAMYALARNFCGKFLSATVATLYTLAPYHALDLYIRGAIGELWAMAILPLVVMCILKIFGDAAFNKRLTFALLGSLSTAALVLSHNISAYMFMPLVGLLVILLTIISKGSWEKILLVALMITLGLLESMYFWLPAIIESSLMKYDTVFNFVDHFPWLVQFIKPYWGYGASVPGSGDGMSFFLGFGAIITLVLSLVVMVVRFRSYMAVKKVFLIWLVICLAFAFFLMNYRSIFVWEIVPLMAYFQFPWRFLLVVSFAVPLMLVSIEGVKKSYLFLLAVLLLAVVGNFSYFRPQDFLGRGDGYFLNKYIPGKVPSVEYQMNQEEYLRLPVSTEVRPGKVYDLFYAGKGFSFREERFDGVNFEGKIIAPEGITLNFGKYNFPGWEVLVDGKKINHVSGRPFGQVTFGLPRGEHGVEVRFRETPFRLAADLVSVGAFVLVSFLLIKYRLAGRKNE